MTAISLFSCSFTIFSVHGGFFISVSYLQEKQQELNNKNKNFPIILSGLYSVVFVFNCKSFFLLLPSI